MSQQQERNAKIRELYETMTAAAIADRFGMSERWVRSIVAAKPRTRKSRATNSGMRGHRRKIFADNPTKRADYLRLARASGAAAARKAMGLPT